MILSNTEIHRAIDEKRLVIEPEPLPRVPTVGQNCPYDTHTVDLKLHDEILVPEDNVSLCVDLTKPGSITKTISMVSKPQKISQDRPFQLKPHQFILARTVERIHLPIQEGGVTLAARIEGKSSRARFGLIVHCTAPTIHPGFDGTLTLEVANLGPLTFILGPDMHIAQLVIEEVKGEVVQNPSGFQGQIDPAGQRA